MAPSSPAPLLGGPADLAAHPNPLAADYTRFRVADRLLLTGHSHQAWPDVAYQAQKQAWLDAATYVDDKWEHAFRRSARIRAGVGDLLEDPGADVALGENTLELVARFLSALPLRERPRLVTTDGEFHTIRRLLGRLGEEGVEIVRVPAHRPDAPVDGLSRRLAHAVDARTAAVLVSSVLYESALRVPELGLVQDACRRHGAELLVDSYHSVNVVPLSLPLEGLADAFVVGGGYKYLQWGEACCFLRLPRQTRLRPILTGWFGEFGELGAPRVPGGVAYGEGADRFAGSTFDPTAHYRAAAVLDHFQTRGLTVPLLRELNQHQVGRLLRRIQEADLDPRQLQVAHEVPLEDRGGFLALQAPQAAELVAALRRRGVFTDARGDRLRLGPAPYLSDTQLDDAVGHLAEIVRELPPAREEPGRSVTG
ncbi:MAG: kynureninase, partial [Gemmatimonadales bacterium]